MSNASGSQRIKALESKVGGMNVELSYTRAQIAQMMGMMLQPFQTKSADEGQQKEESGGNGRETQTMTATAPEGHRWKRGLLAQELAPQ